jgi:cytidylate kinase
VKERKPIIAIDGPVGAGKTTTAREVAEILGFMYIDSGAMYRAVTLDVLNHGVDPDNEEGVGKIAEKSGIELIFRDGIQHTFLNGEDVSERIRSRDVTQAVSAVSALECVRKPMWALQRNAGKKGGIVMEGRDIGTVVFPDADFKIYLDAPIEIRAKRRFDELKSKGIKVEFVDLQDEIRERDRANTERTLAPLKKAQDAIVLDTTGMTLDEQVTAVISIIHGERDE